MKIVYRAENYIEAEIVKGMLVSNGIDAHVSGFYLQGGLGDIGVTDLAKVHVSNEDYIKAYELIDQSQDLWSQAPETQTPEPQAHESQLSNPTVSSESHASEYKAKPQSNKTYVIIVMIILVLVMGYWFSV